MSNLVGEILLRLVKPARRCCSGWSSSWSRWRSASRLGHARAALLAARRGLILLIQESPL
jgi:hypothetical protein